MTLTLSMLRCPDHVAPETRTVPGGEFSIGRDPENDWVLPDPERGLSKRHCVLALRAGSWQVADLSTNGTFVNREGEPIGRGQVRELRDGDRLCFGAYEIEAHIEETEQPRRGGGASGGAAFGRVTATPELFALDPFASPSGRVDARPDPLLGRTPVDDPFASGLSSGSAALPADFDPLAPDPAEREFRGPTQSDHNPSIEDAFAPPQARSVLPDDWDREINLLQPAPPPAPAPIPEPGPAPVRPPPVAAPATRPAEPLTEPALSPSPPPAPPQQPHAADELLVAFLRGADLAEVRPADPTAAMEALGAAFRAMVAGLRQAMIARSAIKGEFRIEQTIIRARGNNPLKFSADDDDALVALLGAGRRTDMGAVEAISDALRDMRLHELATVAAMQAAVRALLAEFEPAKIRQVTEHGSGLSLLPRQRKADAWEAFETLHVRTIQALTDDFDSVFGKAFARAYERALAEISAREPAT
jgi:type VI secretion system protein ImpI/type VI secretion system protein